MTAVPKPTSPSVTDLQAAHDYDHQGPGKLIRSYVHALRRLFQAEAASAFNVRQWQALERRLMAEHQREWERAREAWGTQATAEHLMNLAIAQGDGVAGVIAAASGQENTAAVLHEAFVDLASDAGTWELHTDPTFAAFGFYTAVGWIGLRHAMMAGVRPAALESLLTGHPQTVKTAPKERAASGFRQAVAAVDGVLSPVLAGIVTRTKAAVADHHEAQQERKALQARALRDRQTLATDMAMRAHHAAR